MPMNPNKKGETFFSGMTKRVEVGERGRLRVVAVTWIDSWKNNRDYYTSDETYDAMELKSVGIVVKTNGRGITLSEEYDTLRARYRNISFIPRAMITKITTLGYIVLPERRQVKSAGD
jgi:hypothetical protein